MKLREAIGLALVILAIAVGLIGLMVTVDRIGGVPRGTRFIASERLSVNGTSVWLVHDTQTGREYIMTAGGGLVAVEGDR